jgi:hypothetical protein
MHFTADMGTSQVTSVLPQIDTCFEMPPQVSPQDLGGIPLCRSDRFIVVCKGWRADLSHLTSALPLLRAEIGKRAYRWQSWHPLEDRVFVFDRFSHGGKGAFSGHQHIVVLVVI